MHRQTLTKSELHVEDRALDRTVAAWGRPGKSPQAHQSKKRSSVALRPFEHNTEDMTHERPHPTACRRRRHKNPASVPVAHDLQIPSTPAHRRRVVNEADGPSRSDDERVQSD